MPVRRRLNASGTQDALRACEGGERELPYLAEFPHDKWTVVVEEDENVCYAYLLLEGAVVFDAWAYNRTPAPLLASWKPSDRKMPSVNSAEYVNGTGVLDEVQPNRLSVSWPIDIDSDPSAEVVVCVDGDPIVWLAFGAKPGWAALAVRDGPLARKRPR